MTDINKFKNMHGGVNVIFGTSHHDNSQIFITLHLRESVLQAVKTKIEALKNDFPLVKFPELTMNMPIHDPHITYLSLVVSKETGLLLANQKFQPFWNHLLKNIADILDNAILTLHSKSLYEIMGVFIARNFDQINFADGTHDSSNFLFNFMIQYHIDMIIDEVKKNLKVQNIQTFIREKNPTEPTIPSYLIYRGINIALSDYIFNWIGHISLIHLGIPKNISEERKDEITEQIINNFSQIKGKGGLQLSHINLWSENNTKQIIDSKDNKLDATGHLSRISVNLDFYDETTGKRNSVVIASIRI